MSILTDTALKKIEKAKEESLLLKQMNQFLSKENNKDQTQPVVAQENKDKFQDLYLASIQEKQELILSFNKQIYISFFGGFITAIVLILIIFLIIKKLNKKI